MSMALNTYLDRVMIYANRNDIDAAPIRDELEDHLLKKVDECVDGGMAREDALFQAIEDHGHPAVVGYGLRPRFA